LREALPPRAASPTIFAVVAAITAVPPSFARRFFIARASGSGVTDIAGVSSSSSSGRDEDDDVELAELRAIAWMVNCILSGFTSSELESDDDDDDDGSELESEEDATLRFNLFVVNGLLSSSESESELGLESEDEVDLALCFGTLGSSSSSSVLESESELEVSSEDDVAIISLLPLTSLKVGTEPESLSTSDSSLESEPVSSADSSSLSTSSAEDSVLLESRWDSLNFTTWGTTLWGVSLLLSSKSM
jgi:hypothetical protein